MAELPGYIVLALDAVTFSETAAEYRAASAHAARVIADLPEGEVKDHIEHNFAMRCRFAAARFDWTNPANAEAR